MAISIVRDMRPAYGSARNQGIRPTCLAFAASDAHAAVRGPWVPLSPEFAFYHSQSRSKRPPHQGAVLSTMLEVLRENGQPVESEWPYLASLPSDLASWQPPPGITDLYRRLSEIGKATVDDIVRLLDEGQPVLTIMMLSDCFTCPRVMASSSVIWRRTRPNAASCSSCRWPRHAEGREANPGSK